MGDRFTGLYESIKTVVKLNVEINEGMRYLTID